MTKPSDDLLHAIACVTPYTPWDEYTWNPNAEIATFSKEAPLDFSDSEQDSDPVTIPLYTLYQPLDKHTTQPSLEAYWGELVWYLRTQAETVSDETTPKETP